MTLSEVQQRTANTVWYHLHVESKKNKYNGPVNITKGSRQIQNNLVVTNGERKLGEGSYSGRGLRGINYWT